MVATIPPITQKIVDSQTGRLTEPWYDFFFQLQAPVSWNSSSYTIAPGGTPLLTIGPTVTPKNSDVATQSSINIQGITPLTIANGGNAVVKCCGLVIVQEANLGDAALYFLAPAGVVRNVAMGFGTWVNSTTVPAAGQLSVAWDGASSFRVYNNQGAQESVYYFLIGT